MKQNKKIIIGILIGLLIIVIGLVIAYKVIENSVINRADFKFKVENSNSSTVETVNHEQNDIITETKSNTQNTTFTKTYNVLNIADSNDEDYLYITIRQFQEEEVKTVKVERKIASIVEKGDNYEFTFKYTDSKVAENIESIFDNTILISIKKTDKEGLDQIQDSINEGYTDEY